MDFNRLSHAYIVSPELANTIAMGAVCSADSNNKPCGNCANCIKSLRDIHPDIEIIKKAEDKKDIIVEQIRAIKKKVIEIPNDSAKKVYIVVDADLMNMNAQNAFLQLLEEPPNHAVFILSTQHPSALLPTVLSRCVRLNTLPVHQELSSVADEMALELLAAIDSGDVALVTFMFKLEKLEKEVFYDFIEASREHVVKMLAFSPNGATDSAVLSRTERLLVKARDMVDLNVGLGHVSGMICAGLVARE